MAAEKEIDYEDMYDDEDDLESGQLTQHQHWSQHIDPYLAQQKANPAAVPANDIYYSGYSEQNIPACNIYDYYSMTGYAENAKNITAHIDIMQQQQALKMHQANPSSLLASNPINSSSVITETAMDGKTQYAMQSLPVNYNASNMSVAMSQSNNSANNSNGGNIRGNCNDSLNTPVKPSSSDNSNLRGYQSKMYYKKELLQKDNEVRKDVKSENANNFASNSGSPSQLAHKLTQCRNELKNLRKNMHALHSEHRKDVKHLEKYLEYSTSGSAAEDKNNTSTEVSTDSSSSQYNKFNPIFENWKPIGYIDSTYKNKNGTPRQGCLVKQSKGKIRILDALYNNPQHSLEGLEQYSHVWIIFAFDQNNSNGVSDNTHAKAKVAPPRLGGEKLGVFATRSPHRPNPIGLTLAKLDAIEGGIVHVSGIDLLHGTAIIDIKPYIPRYDAPPPSDEKVSIENDDSVKSLVKNNLSEKDSRMLNGTGEMNCLQNSERPKKLQSKGISVTKFKSTADYSHLLDRNNEAEHKKTTTEQLSSAQNEASNGEVHTATWLDEANNRALNVVLNPVAEKQINRFNKNAMEDEFKLEMVDDSASLRQLIIDTVSSDPRSSYRRNQCPDLLHHFTIDVVKVTVAYMDDKEVEVLRVVPASGS